MPLSRQRVTGAAAQERPFRLLQRPHSSSSSVTNTAEVIGFHSALAGRSSIDPVEPAAIIRLVAIHIGPESGRCGLGLTQHGNGLIGYPQAAPAQQSDCVIGLYRCFMFRSGHGRATGGTGLVVIANKLG
ncbi:hypothetical protein D9M69_445840 [compost metagenome]